jgi:hypothetical protein
MPGQSTRKQEKNSLIFSKQNVKILIITVSLLPALSPFPRQPFLSETDEMCGVFRIYHLWRDRDNIAVVVERAAYADKPGW